MAYGIPGVSPNIISQQQRISAIPSDPKETALARYLIQLTQQNKVGTPEYFFAAGEFSNRQKVRQEQAAKQRQGPKVVENITAQAVQKAAPMMQGVGNLDAGGMERIDSTVYSASGGIVAFDDGGEVQRFQNQGLVQSPAARRGFTMFDIQNIGPTVQSSFEGMFPKEDVEAVRLREQIRELLAGRGGPYGFFKPQTDVEFARNRELAQRLNTMSLQELRQTLNNLSATGSTPSTAPVVTEGPMGGRQGTPADVRRADVAPAETPPYIPRSMQMTDIAAAPPQIPTLPPLDLKDIRNQATAAAQLMMGERSEIPSRAEAVHDVRESLKAAGYDFDLFKNQIKELNEQKDQLKLDRKEAANLRVLEAGLGILGGESPYAFVNIGKGASPAVKGFAEDIKDLKKLERERQKAIREIQVAQNQVAAGMGEKADRRVERAEDRYDKYSSDLRNMAANLATSFAQLMSSRDVAELNAKVQFGVAGLPGAQERLIRGLGSGDPTLLKGARTYSDLLGVGGRGDTAARTAAFNTWSKSARLQQEYPNFEDFFALRGASGTGFTFLGKE